MTAGTTENYNNGGPVHDSFGIVFGDGNDNAITSADAIKPMNLYENFGRDHNGTYLSFEYREMPVPSEVLALYSSGYTVTDYTLQLMVEGLHNTVFYLNDSYTGATIPLVNGVNNYGFTVDATIV